MATLKESRGFDNVWNKRKFVAAVNGKYSWLRYTPDDYGKLFRVYGDTYYLVGLDVAAKETDRNFVIVKDAKTGNILRVSTSFVTRLREATTLTWDRGCSVCGAKAVWHHPRLDRDYCAKHAPRDTMQRIKEHTNISTSLARKALDIINEATYEPPAGWDKGFQHPYRIGGGGTERPFLKNGKWKLRVWNVQDKKHYIYDFDTDMFDLEETGPWCNKSVTEAIIVGDDMPAAEVQRVYNEIGDVSDTEILCGIRKLKVNERGQVLSYVTEAAVSKASLAADDKRVACAMHSLGVKHLANPIALSTTKRASSEDE